ncbi:MAG: hypothetical protein IJH90_02445, partial [Mogibacterium sp.]|nr:hypothetical protein [Mogibacterium sp.]
VEAPEDEYLALELEEPVAEEVVEEAAEEAEEVAEEVEEEPVDEEELFAEMEEEAPEKTGMTIAAPADRESEIEALKKRLAELLGTDWEEPQVIEKTDKLTAEDLVEEPAVEAPEDEYLALELEEPVVETEEVFEEAAEEVEEPVFEAEELVEEAAEETEEVVEETAEEVEEVVEEVEEPVLEAEELVEETAEGVEEVVEEPVEEVEETAEEPVELSFEDELAQFVVEKPAVAEPVADTEELVEEAKGPDQSIEDFLASILKQEAAPVAAASGLTAGAVVEDEYLNIDALAAEIDGTAEPAVEEAVEEVEETVEEPVVEEPEAEVVEPVSEEPVVEPVVEEPIVEEPVKKETDALSIEDLEKDLFGTSADAGAEVEATKKIDKFYTLYRKNEEFQRLLDEEYNKLKAAGGPVPEQVLPDPEPPVSAAKAGKMIEDATIYQAFEIPKEALEAADAKAAAELEPGSRKVEKDTSVAAPAAAVATAAAVTAAASTVKADPQVEYEEVDRGGGFLTVLAVIIAILLVILLAVILILNFAPDSDLAIQIDSIIENITSHFTAVDTFAKQILL